MALATNRPRESRFRIKGTDDAAFLAGGNELVLPLTPLVVRDEPLLPPAGHLRNLRPRVNRLRDLVETCINLHLPQDKLEVLKAAEESERDIITRLVGKIARKRLR